LSGTPAAAPTIPPEIGRRADTRTVRAGIDGRKHGQDGEIDAPDPHAVQDARVCNLAIGFLGSLG
jgi:hypothetical protein